MKQIVPFALAITLSVSAAFGQVTVNANEDIYRVGNNGASLAGSDGGANPTTISISSGTSYLTFSVSASNLINSAIHGITLNSGGGYNNADGTVISGTDNGPTIGSGSGYSFNLANGNLSGITEPGIGGLVGVFTSPTSLSNPAPASLDYYNNPSLFTAGSSSPLLDQVFLIGDGLTGDGAGTTQQFYVPTGATQLFLGISDAPAFDGNNGPGAYGDNSGTYTVNYSAVAATQSVPDRASTLLLLSVALALIIGFSRFRSASPLLERK